MKLLKTPLFQHQINNLQFHLTKKKSMDWSDCGTGKSLIALAKFAILHNTHLANDLLIISPLSLLETWHEQISIHTDFQCIKLTGSLGRKLKLLDEECPIFIVTYDSLPGRSNSTAGVLLEKLLRKKFDMIILDEATYIKNLATLRSRAIELLCDNTPYVIGLSGTPISKDPMQILTLYRIIDGGDTFGVNVYRARNVFFQNVGWKYPKWVLKADRKQEFTSKLFKNAVRVRKEECLELPEKVWNKRVTYLTSDQIDLYTPIAADLVKEMDLEEGKVTIKTILTKLAKLCQITSGFLYTDKSPVVFQPNPKLELLRSLLQEISSEEQIIIYCWWKQDIQLISSLLDELGEEYVTLYGATTVEERKRAIGKFQSGNARLFVANQQAGGFGLTLIQASYMIYYSTSWGVTNFLQSQDRIHRVGQTKTCFYYNLVIKDSIDEYILESLRQGILLTDELTNKATWNRLKKNLTLVLKGKGEPQS